MLNSTSGSIEAGFSSTNNRNKQSFASPNSPAQPAKRKRNLPGNPDPEAEVVALSPRTLVTTNRFICEVCNKGFQRDQNLQLHRRGHNLPWKLKTRTNKEVIKKKVYICPEPTCIHHDPLRALGDLTGIKKHYSRKHGEKKWKCEKCEKRYAVKSDWKAHSKICGTREYRCDCGTLFSRRDSFITHRAFCDVLAEETRTSSTSHPNLHDLQPLLIPLKSEQELRPSSFNLSPEMPQWLPGQSIVKPGPGSSMHPHEISNPNPITLSSNFQAHSPHMSATALLQKAAQMGVTVNKPCDVERTVNVIRQFASRSGSTPSEFGFDSNLNEPSQLGIAHNILRPHQGHMNANGYNISTSLATREDIGTGFIHDDLAAFGNINNNNNTINSLSSTRGFQESDFDDTLNGLLNQKSDGNFLGVLTKSAGPNFSGNGQDGLTRDFLGLRAFPQRDFLNMAGIDRLGSSSNNQQNQNPPPWQS